MKLPQSILLLSTLLSYSAALSLPMSDIRTISKQQDSVGEDMGKTIEDFVASLELPETVVANVVETLSNDKNVAGLLTTPDPAAIQERSLNDAAIQERSLIDAATVTLACWLSELKFSRAYCDSSEGSYTNLIQVNWSQACWTKPKCIITPKSTEDVSAALKIISFFRVPYAVRSGGHSPSPGAATTDSGILIDLGQMRQKTITSDRKVASIGPGLRWVDVYEFLDPYGVSAIGGRIPDVGVGGLILGGGLSHFANGYGTAADQVKNFEVVLPDSRIVNANAQTNTDLYWALKGGGPNFGIVTRFDLYTIPVRNIWFAAYAYAPDTQDELLDALVGFQSNPDNEVHGSLLFQLGKDVNTVGFIYNQPWNGAGLPTVFKDFKGIATLAPVFKPENGSVVQLTQYLAGIFTGPPMSHDYRAVSTLPSASLYKTVAAYYRTTILPKVPAGSEITFTIQPISAAVGGVVRNGGNAMGIPKVAHQWFTTVISGPTGNNFNTLRNLGIDLTNKWSSTAKSKGKSVSYIFMNDSSRDQSPITSYGSANVQKLKSVQKKYDPSGYGKQRSGVGGFLL